MIFVCIFFIIIFQRGFLRLMIRFRWCNNVSKCDKLYFMHVLQNGDEWNLTLTNWINVGRDGFDDVFDLIPSTWRWSGRRPTRWWSTVIATKSTRLLHDDHNHRSRSRVSTTVRPLTVPKSLIVYDLNSKLEHILCILKPDSTHEM